jgi:L-ascorbate metabolism protein UlaG (beta-lactamase superfamily)
VQQTGPDPSLASRDPSLASRARIEYVGHATVFVDLDGVRLLTDPLLRNRVAHLRRSTPVSARTRRGVDAVLISHAHYDHLDLPSLEKLGKKLPIVVPRGLGGLLRKRRFESVLEVEAGETLTIGELQVKAVPAEHDGSRGPLGASAEPLGFVVSGSRSIYFAGDTDLFDEMRDLGPVDVGLIPIWGWGPGLGGGHLDPPRAAEAAAMIRPSLVVPIHWGTYFPIHLGLTRTPAFVDVPPLEFLAAMRETAPDIEVRVLQPGETFELSVLDGKQIG